MIKEVFGTELLVPNHSTVTDLAKFLGWSTLHPLKTAIWYDNNCRGILERIGVNSSKQDGISIQ